MVNKVSCKPTRTSLGRTGFVANKAGTQQTIWLPPWVFSKPNKNIVPPLMWLHNDSYMSHREFSIESSRSQKNTGETKF